MKLWPVLLLVTAVGCPASPTGPTTPGTGSGSAAGPTSAAGDNLFDVPAIDIKGVTFEPSAVSRPGMPTTEPKKGVTLDKQRKTYAGTKDPILKQAYAAQLATLLYIEFKKENQAAKTEAEREEAKKKWLTEARQVLRDSAALAGDAKVDDLTLRMLGTYELLFDDFAAAEKAWSAMANKAPTGKEAPYNRAWWALSLLWQFKNAEALAVVKDTAPSEKQPELAYATAWARWRTGDDAGAWQAMVIAAGAMQAKTWTDQPTQEAMDRDVLVFAGRANVTFDAAQPQLTAIFGKAKNQQYVMLVKLGLQAYGFAGRWGEGVRALDKALETAGETAPLDDKPIIRFAQADYTVRLDSPEVSAKYAKLTLDAIAACGTKCTDKAKQEFVESIYGMGRLFHLLYATANDVRYYQPAHDLYAASTSLLQDATKKAEATKDAATLEQTLKNTKVGTGKHEPQAIGVLIQRHNQEVQACYETSLGANPKLAGSITVTLESDEAGAIKGLATEPKAGLADLSAVAGCVGERAKAWKLPKRGQPGATRIKLTYSLSPRKAI